MTKQEFLAMSLPYGLFAIDECDFDNNDFDEIVIYNGLWYSDEFQTNNNTLMIPIIRPLSELTKEIEHKGEKFVPYIELLRLSSFDIDNMTSEDLEDFKKAYSAISADIEIMSFSDGLKLIEWHFDIAGLIEKGEAIDVNTLTESPYK